MVLSVSDRKQFRLEYILAIILLRSTEDNSDTNNKAPFWPTADNSGFEIDENYKMKYDTDNKHFRQEYIQLH